MVKILSANGPARNRLEEVRKIFSSLIEDYAPETLLVEKPLSLWTEQSRFLEAVINEIKCLSRKEGIRVREFSPLIVRKIICGNERANKKDVAETAASVYPELKNRLNQGSRPRDLYWGHMFDAVGLGMYYLKRQAKHDRG
jgi:Holliday junction resolvasome RuvABC endonuclease subunit